MSRSTAHIASSPQPVAAPAWHAAASDDALAQLHTTRDGLTLADARQRLARVGPNAMPLAPPASAWGILLAQFRSVVVALLVAAAFVAFLTSDLADTMAIAAVLAVNVALGFLVEMRARRAVEALGRLEARHATVVRQGLPEMIDAREVVPGDVLLIEAGEVVAADARLIAAVELRVVESTLTGESLPISKHVRPLAGDAPLPERRNMLYAGTTVAAGTARAVVVATGAATELGMIGRLVERTVVEETPLERRLDTLGRQLVWFALLIGAATAALAAYRGVPTSAMLQMAIALAVAAVPEGLPAVATITLALAVRRMARRRALVRRLPSVEALGSVTVICTDKTGTLTAGAMTVTTIWAGGVVYDVTGDGYAPEGTFLFDGGQIDPIDHPELLLALRIGALVNRANAVRAAGGWIARGDPTEAALTVLARKAGIERAALVRESPEIGEVPFSSDRKLMATFHQAAAGPVWVYVKGAPHRVLELCARVIGSGGERTLDRPIREAMLAANDVLASRGLRVLALACGPVARAEESALAGLTLVGLAGMLDPPAPGVKDTIRRFRDAGIRTVMITGDQRGTAAAIARDLGLATIAPALDGRDLERLSDDELRARVADVEVFSRVSPEAKLRIVSAFQQRGEIVAMLGDGVNDAAALKKADVGVTMGGRGTDVARETAAVVLEDDRFQTIGVAIEEGRVVFDNIRRFVFYLFSCNLAEIFVLLGAQAVGLPLPMSPIQILWLNLVTDTVPALALAAEPGETDVMRRPPRDPQSAILSPRFMRSIAAYAVLIAASTAAVIAATHGADPARARTMTFTTLAFAQLLHLGNARSRQAVVSPRRAAANLYAVGAVVLGVALQLLVIYFAPLHRVLGVTALNPGDWLVIGIASLVPAVIGQGVKTIRSGWRHASALHSRRAS